MVNWRREDLARIFSALVLPVDESERLDRGALRALVEMELADGVEGFYCCGSSGEGLLMSLEERMRVVEDVMNTVNGRVSVVAHVAPCARRMSSPSPATRARWAARRSP